MFKKKLKENEKLNLSSNIGDGVRHIKLAIIFMQDYGKYKNRKKYKISDNEYKKQMDKSCMELQMMFVKLKVAESIIEINKLNYIYHNSITDIMKNITEKSVERSVENENNVSVD